VARGALTRGPAPRNLVTVGNISRPQRNSLFEYICIRHRSSGNRANPPEISRWRLDRKLEQIHVQHEVEAGGAQGAQLAHDDVLRYAGHVVELRKHG
jgi:hypothetical protein